MTPPPNLDPNEYALALIEAVLSITVILACLLFAGWVGGMLWVCIARGCVSQ